MKNLWRSVLLLSMAVILINLTACSPKEVEVRGDEEVEGKLGTELSLASDSMYLVSFANIDSKTEVSTTLCFEITAACDYKEVSLTATIVDGKEMPLCKLKPTSKSGTDKLMNAIRRGEGSVKIKFIAVIDPAQVDDIIKNGKFIRISSSNGVLNKTPEQIQHEQDSIAKAATPELQISDFLEKAEEAGEFSGKTRDLKGNPQVVALLEAKGFKVNKRSKRKEWDDCSGDYYTIETIELSRIIGSMTENITLISHNEFKIDFCDNEAATNFMKKMTADGYRNGVSSDCYYAGSEVKRKGKVVTLRQISEC